MTGHYCEIHREYSVTATCAKCAGAERMTELEAALRDAMPFVAIHVDRWTRDNDGVMHETHRELLDRIGRLTGKPDLAAAIAKIGR